MKERIVSTTLLKETEHSQIFLAELDDSAKILVKHLKNAKKEIYETLHAITSLHFPKIFALEENGDTLIVYEEYIEGDTLSDLLKSHSISADDLPGIMLQICEGISFLHQMNPPFIHRDIKPENLILSKDGTVKIIDFNAARIYNKTTDNDTVQLGTAEYAPEFCHRTDFHNRFSADSGYSFPQSCRSQ